MGSNGQGSNSGASLGAREVSPKTKARDARKRRRQDQAWAARSGPVTVTRRDPELPLDPAAQPDPEQGAAT